MVTKHFEDGWSLANVSLRLLADDLTGALDSACAFASPLRPVSVFADRGWARSDLLEGDRRIAVSTETRALDAVEAMRVNRAQIQDMKAAAVSRTLWFKKIDSVMRGHPVAETAAIMQAGGFTRCIVAPAFPAQGRITRDGQQFRRGGGDDWLPVGPDLVAGFNSFGLEAAVWRDGRSRPDWSLPILVLDADNAGMLRDRAQALKATAGDALWVGAGGLAAALNPPQPALAVPRVSLIIVGTNHPATRAQIENLRLCVRASVAEMEGGTVELVDSFETTVLVPARSLNTSRDVGRALDGSLAHVVGSVECPGGILVTGGETLLRVLRACGAHHIDCMGSLAPGIPVGRIRGGRWDGTDIVTKSGGFGTPDLFTTLLASAGRLLPGRSENDDPADLG